MSEETQAYDVVIAGAGIAGCTAATVYGRAGLRVALLDRQRSVSSHKVVCGHFILGGTRDTLARLGFWERMVAEGAAVSAGLGVWTSAGWIPPGPTPGAPPAISLRRTRLDPLLRDIAAGTPGVDLLMGHTVVDLVEDSGAVVGLVATTPHGSRVVFRAPLVVGADGHRSTVARLAAVPEDVAPNARFLFWAYYRGARMRGPGDGQVWLLDPDIAVCDRTDDGLVQIAAFPSKARQDEFRTDRAGAYDRFVAALPEGPSLDGAERVSKIIGTLDHPCVRRHPTPRPGLALVGDAATTSDPVPAVGCGWAFRGAAWLAEATAPALVEGRDLRASLRRYRRAHRFIERYDTIGRRDALAQPPNRVQHAVRAAAVHDRELARRLAMFSMRAAPPSVLINPRVAIRALRLAGAAGMSPR